MSLPLLSASASTTWSCTLAFKSFLWQRSIYSTKHFKNRTVKCYSTFHRLRYWTFPRNDFEHHHVWQSSTPANPPQPGESLRWNKESGVPYESHFERLRGVWQPLENDSASDELDEIDASPQKSEATFDYIPPTGCTTPSARLLSALQRAGFSGLIPRRLRNKVDLSFFRVRTMEAYPASSRWIAQTNTSGKGEAEVLSDGLAAYITHVLAPSLPFTGDAFFRHTLDDEQLSKVYTPEYLKLLNRKGYEVEDVMTWAWIAASKSADQAVKRLFAASTKLSDAGRMPVPLFMFLLILRSRNVSATGLKLLMNMLWTRTPVLDTYHPPFLHRIQISEQSALILIVRLIRHARKVWPEALGEITSLMTRLIGSTGRDNSPMKSERAQRLCHIYNRILTLLSLPTSANPFRAVPIQQQAQFHLLRKMNQFDPKLPLTREGFRALTKVQVAHKKTDKERRWARFKSLSWPPWKENKSGVDAESGSAGSLSRAIDVLSRMSESGYNTLIWEKQAKVLAGWDTDRSPTIQRRKLLERAPLIRSISSLDDGLSADADREHEIWAARISATRTVKEAWACFCSFEKYCATNGLQSSRQTPGRLAPWHAMFERLFYSAKDIPGDHLDPGDGKEAYPEPISPHDFLYVPTEPPSVGDLFNKMVTRGLKPAGRLLADLVDHAPSVSEGFKFISHSLLSEVKKDVLRHAEKYHPAYIRETLISIPDFLVSAFVRLLTRVGSADLELCRPASASSLGTHRPRSSRTIRVNPYTYAAQLVKILETPYVPTWQALFAGLLRQLRKSKFKKDSRYGHVYRIWISMQDLLQAMTDAGITVNLPCVQIIYQISEEVILCSPYLGSTGRGSAKDITNAAKLTVKRLFHNTVVGYQDTPSKSWLPIGTEASLLNIPSPANLPGLVRVLGVAGDFNGILCLLQWMSRFAPELGAVSEEVSNGQRMLRRTLITIRVFLERSWTEPESEPAIQIPRFLIDEAQKLVQQHVRWGGWPTDEEVAEYLKKNKGAYLHRIRELEMGRLSENRPEAEDIVLTGHPPQAP